MRPRYGEKDSVITPFHVLAHLKQITVLDEAGERDVLPLCLTALEELRSRLRDPRDIGDVRVLEAAAAQALYKLRLRQQEAASSEAGEIVSFKAGDVSIQTQGKTQETITRPLATAKALREDAMLSVQPLCKDMGFWFAAVEG